MTLLQPTLHSCEHRRLGGRKKTSFFFFVFFFFLLLSTGVRAKDTISSVHQHELSADFYAKTCPQVDNIVGSVTSQRHKTLPASGPATIRLFFHDCFVQGCDGSILLEAGAEGKVERQMFENRNLGTEGFDTVNLAKAAVEKICPGLVSCADILAIAARDFVHLAGGPYYAVKKGRKDSKYSPSLAGLPTIVRVNLPRANSTITELIALFAAKGLTTTDLVALSGAHTIGFSHCDQFVSRLYSGSTIEAPAMEPRLLQALRLQCPRTGGNADVVVPLDVVTPFEFDNEYYEGIGKGLGVLATDQALGLDRRTETIVREMATDKGKFFAAFEAGMERLGGIRVKKGKKGKSEGIVEGI
ncbi:peroxidase 19 [Dendrobium catenatum]|uniref:peroxidase 19 n=1 Tax=Dendrobium catenatum TaxID=906689 RepID=UPI0010A01617|nr:peroxidase 19 [Dendrobium catenatum]